VSSGDLGRRAAVSSTHPTPYPWWAWAITFASYVFLGYHLRTYVLNWIVGPLYPLLVMHLLPNAVRRLLGRPSSDDPSASSAS
jgi:hypothetical protein